MNTTSRVILSLPLAIAVGMAIGIISGAAIAMPNTDVYAYPGTQPAHGIAVGPIEVVRAPVPGLVTAYRQAGPAAAGLSFERPIVVAAPHVGRGHNQRAGAAVSFTFLVAGN